MITGITGILESTGPDWVQVKVGGSVSLQVYVPSSTVQELGDVGGEVRLHTRLYIRDDEAVLYGFSSAEALELFRKLNAVAGIGPRTSLSLLSFLGPQALIAAVATGDVPALSKVPGVGKKSAGRLVLELKGKLDEEYSIQPGGLAALDGEVVSALMALGYTATESRRLVASIGDAADLSIEEKIRRALQQVGG